MKFLLIFLLALPLATFSQSKRDYNRTMEQFVRFYNNDDVNEVCKLFQNTPEYGCFWRMVEQRSNALDKYGKILSYEYLGKEEPGLTNIRVFKVVFEKMGVKAMAFEIAEDRLFRTFRFNTSSDDIDAMLAKANRSW